MKKHVTISILLASLFLCPVPFYGQMCAFDDPEIDCDEAILEGCALGTYMPSGSFCDPQNDDIFVLRVYIYLLTDELGDGAQTWSNVNIHMNRMIKQFLPHGILFSFEGWEYLPIPSDLFYGVYEQPEFEQIQTYGYKENHLNIYFCGAGIYSNGRAMPIYSDKQACIIGDAPSSNHPDIPFTATEILAHEVGHCLGLMHPIDAACNIGDCVNFNLCTCFDYVLDTDPSYDDNVMDKIGINNCPDCPRHFTEGQKRRMKRYLTNCNFLLPIITNEPARICSNLQLSVDISPGICLPGLTIESGATLKLTSDLTFQTDAVILVKTGGRLTVDGATLSGCDYWQGIEVNGNLNETQYPTSKQGYVILKNGAVIENALSPLLVRGGGIAVSENTDFVNCGCSNFEYYPKNNLSRFSNCDFKANSSFGKNLLGCNVWLYGVKGINFIDCTFKVDGLPGVGYSPIAIISLDAGISVSNSWIEGYKEGIRAQSLGLAPFSSLQVSQCTLKNNYISISSWNVVDATIINNVFEGIGGYFTSAQKPRGLELRNCTGFTVKDNKFYGVSNASRKIGILAYNTGSEGNLINKNIFSGIYVANQAELLNRETQFGGLFGLQYWCNTNTSSNSYDFYVWDNGIAKNQGDGKATLNVFSHFNSNKGDFNNQSSLGINYYHDASFVGTPQPGYYFGITLIQTDLTNDCDDIDDPKKLTAEEEEVVVQNYNNAKSAYLIQRNTYVSLLDGGNTASLTATVTGATATNRDAVYQQLLSVSPYLTRSVLEAFVNKDDIFLQSQLETVLSVNQDELRNPPFQAFLQAELSSTLAANILAHQHEVTARTSVESQLGSLKTTMHQSANRIIHSELADTTGLNLPKIRTWFANKTSQEADYVIVETYLWEKDTIAARLVRDSISIKYSLTSGQLVEHNYYRQWAEIKIIAMRQDKNLAALDSATVQQIKSIADNSTGLAATQTQNLLNAFYGFDYQIDPKTPNEGGEGLILPPSIGGFISQSEEMPTIAAYPNPVKDVVTFKFLLPENTFDATLYLTNIHGNRMMTLPVTGQRGEVSLSVKDLPVGIYLYHLRYPGGKSQPYKLVLTK